MEWWISNFIFDEQLSIKFTFKTADLEDKDVISFSDGFGYFQISNKQKQENVTISNNTSDSK